MRGTMNSMNSVSTVNSVRKSSCSTLAVYSYSRVFNGELAASGFVLLVTTTPNGDAVALVDGS